MNTIRISFAEIFYLFGTFHGVFMAMILLLSKKSHRGTLYLALLILLFSFYLFENVLYSSGYLRYVPHFLLTTLPLTFLIGPLFYFYVLKSSSIHFLLKPVHAIHLLPFIIELILLLPFYRLSGDIKANIYETSIVTTAEWQFSSWFAGYLLYVFSACGYFIASYKRVSRLIKHDSQNYRLPWLRQASLALLIYVLLGLFMSLYLFLDGSMKDVLYHSNLLLQTVLIQMVGYTAFVKPKIFQAADANGKKYKFSSLDKATMEDYRIRLVQLMEAEKPYLDPDLSADYFVQKLGISKHHFSQLLTESLGTSFYDLINTYRVERAKQLLTEDAYRDAKVIHIAYDSGFSHKSTFLRSFKKITGHTPSEFRKKSKKRVSLH